MSHNPLVRPPFDVFAPEYVVRREAMEAMRAIERLDAQLEAWSLDEKQKDRLYRDALARNAYATARIEGNPHTLEEVTQILRETTVPTDREAPDEREYLTWRAIVDALDAHPVPVDVAGICKLHAQLFDGVLPERLEPGQLKSKANAVGVGGIPTYIPTAPERVSLELQNALDWFHTSPEHPVVRAAILFHEFEGIHPFLDGNGRLGRLLLMQALHHAGYEHIRWAPLDYAFNADRQTYYGELARVEEAAWDFTSWIDYIAATLQDVYLQATDAFRFQGELPPMPEGAAELARWLHAHAQSKWVRMANIHEAFPAVTSRTLQRYLARLLDAGIIVREGERKGTRYKLA